MLMISIGAARDPFGNTFDIAIKRLMRNPACPLIRKDALIRGALAASRDGAAEVPGIGRAIAPRAVYPVPETARGGALFGSRLA